MKKEQAVDVLNIFILAKVVIEIDQSEFDEVKEAIQFVLNMKEVNDK